jgi:hypothetical protein
VTDSDPSRRSVAEGAAHQPLLRSAKTTSPLGHKRAWTSGRVPTWADTYTRSHRNRYDPGGRHRCRCLHRQQEACNPKKRQQTCPPHPSTSLPWKPLQGKRGSTAKECKPCQLSDLVTLGGLPCLVKFFETTGSRQG